MKTEKKELLKKFKAVIEDLSNSFHPYEKGNMEIIFAGHHMAEDYYYELLNYLSDKEFICPNPWFVESFYKREF